MVIMNKNFCKAPFSSLEIIPTGDARICCKMPATSIPRPDGSLYRVTEDNVSVIWNSPWLNDFRQKFINGERPAECKMCWDDEAAGIFSYRKQLDFMKVDIVQPKLKSLVLKLSNKCNCACRICSFWLSSLWQTELEKSNRWDNKHTWFAEENAKDKITEENWEDWKSHLHSIDRLFIYGGEPLINFEVLRMLDYLVDNNLSKDITLILNTNATVINDKVTNIFNQFKEVLLYYSIDDINDRYNYERWPAKFSNVVRDLTELHETYVRTNVNIALYSSISIFNVLHLNEILTEFKKFPKFKINFDNLIHDPRLLSIYSLPESAKIKVKESLELVDWNQYWDNPADHKTNIRNFLDLYKTDYTGREYIEKLDDLLGIDDGRRKQDWKTTFPDLLTLLQE
jgi:sulfatase maturation enzyme AslB (radical SAM superfamily)